MEHLQNLKQHIDAFIASQSSKKAAAEQTVRNAASKTDELANAQPSKKRTIDQISGGIK